MNNILLWLLVLFNSSLMRSVLKFNAAVSIEEAI